MISFLSQISIMLSIRNVITIRVPRRAYKIWLRNIVQLCETSAGPKKTHETNPRGPCRKTIRSPPIGATVRSPPPPPPLRALQHIARITIQRQKQKPRGRAFQFCPRAYNTTTVHCGPYKFVSSRVRQNTIIYIYI